MRTFKSSAKDRERSKAYHAAYRASIAAGGGPASETEVARTLRELRALEAERERLGEIAAWANVPRVAEAASKTLRRIERKFHAILDGGGAGTYTGSRR